jgi:hypothetical protein
MELPITNPLSDADFPTRTAAFTATAASTATWPAGPQAVSVWATAACHVLVGEGVTATTTSFAIPANTLVNLILPTGTGAPWRVSAIQTAAGGTLYARPINYK